MVSRGSWRILNSAPDLLVERLEVGLDLVGVLAHRAELEAGERLAGDPGPYRAVDRRSARAQLDRDGDREQHRREQDQPHRGEDEVEGALERVVDPLEHRGPQREQRHALAGHELGPVDQDLHRRRRDVDRHAALMAEVDELDGPLLREVGVGDDHLLDALPAEDLAAARPGLPSERRPFCGRGVSEM